MQRSKQEPPSPSYSAAETSTNVVSSMANSGCHWELSSPSQDSSWASYIADFVAAQQEESTSNGSASSSVVCKKRSSRKRKIATGDDPLEDTACSSPVKKPPKAKMRNETRRTTCDVLLSQVDAGFAKIKDVRISEVDGVMKSPNDSDLRKKGLCLVPLSMLMEFLQ